MSSRSEAEISDTVRDCVTECLRARDPRDCINDFIRRLVDERGWLQIDADQAARDATEVLRTIGPHFGADQGD